MQCIGEGTHVIHARHQGGEACIVLQADHGVIAGARVVIVVPLPGSLRQQKCLVRQGHSLQTWPKTSSMPHALSQHAVTTQIGQQALGKRNLQDRGSQQTWQAHSAPVHPMHQTTHALHFTMDCPMNET